MKKHLLILVMALLTLLPVSVKAAPGDNCANPITYAVDGTNELLSGTHWYCIRISDALAYLGENDLRVKLENRSNAEATATVSIYFGCDESPFATESKAVPAGETWTSSSRLTNRQLQRFGTAYTYVYAKVVANVDLSAEVVPTEPQPQQAANEQCLNAQVIKPGVDYQVLPNAETWFTYTFDGNERLSAVFTPSQAGAVFSKIVSVYDDCAASPIKQRVTKANVYDKEQYPVAGQYWASVEVGAQGGTVRFARHEPQTALDCAGATQVVIGDNEVTNGSHVYYFMPKVATEGVFTLANGQQVEVKEGVCGGTLRDLSGELNFFPQFYGCSIQLPKLEAGHSYFFYVTGDGTFNFSAAGSSCDNAIELEITDGQALEIQEGTHFYKVNVTKLLKYLQDNNKDLMFRVRNLRREDTRVVGKAYDADHELIEEGSKTFAAGYDRIPNYRLTQSLLKVYQPEVCLEIEASASLHLIPVLVDRANSANPDCLQATPLEDGKTYSLEADKTAWFSYDFDGCTYITAEYVAEKATHNNVTKEVAVYKDCNEAPLHSKAYTANEFSRVILPSKGTYYASIKSVGEKGFVTVHMHTNNELFCSCAKPVVVGLNENPNGGVFSFVPQASGVAHFELQPGQAIQIMKGLCGTNENLTPVNTTEHQTPTGTIFEFNAEKLPDGHAYYAQIGAGDFVFGAAGTTCEDAITVDIDTEGFTVQEGERYYAFSAHQVIEDLKAKGLEGQSLAVKIHNPYSEVANVEVTLLENCGDILFGPEARKIKPNSDYIPNKTISWKNLLRYEKDEDGNPAVYQLFVKTNLAVEISVQPSGDCIATELLFENGATEVQHEVKKGVENWFKYTFEGCEYLTGEIRNVDGSEHRSHKTVEVHERGCKGNLVLQREGNGFEFNDEYVMTKGVYYAVITPDEDGIVTFRYNDASNVGLLCACATEVVAGETYLTCDATSSPASYQTPKVYVFNPEKEMDAVVHVEGRVTMMLVEGMCSADFDFNQEQAMWNEGDFQWHFDALEPGHAYYIVTLGCGSFKIGEQGDQCGSAVGLDFEFDADGQPVPVRILEGDHWYEVNVDEVLELLTLRDASGAVIGHQDLKIQAVNTCDANNHVYAAIYESCDDASHGELLIDGSRTLKPNQEWKPSRRITFAQLSKYEHDMLKVNIQADCDLLVTPEITPNQNPVNPDCFDAVEIVPGEEYEVIAGKDHWYKYTFNGCSYLNATFEAGDPTVTNSSKFYAIFADCRDASDINSAIKSGNTSKNVYDKAIVPPAGEYFVLLRPEADGKVIVSDLIRVQNASCPEPYTPGNDQPTCENGQPKINWWRLGLNAAGKYNVVVTGLDKFELYEGIYTDAADQSQLQLIKSFSNGEELFDFPQLERGHNFYIYTEGCGSYKIGEPGQDCTNALPFVIDPNNFFGAPIHVNEGCTWYSIDVDQVLAVMEANGVSAEEPANLKIRIQNCNDVVANVKLTVYDACGGERIGSKTKTIPAASNGQCHEWNPDSRLTYHLLKSQYEHKQLKLEVCTDLEIDITPVPGQDVTPREGCKHATKIVPLQGYNILGGDTYWFYYDFDGCTYPSAVFAPKDGHKVEKYVAIWQGEDCDHLKFLGDRTSTRDTYNRTDLIPSAGRYFASIELTNLREEGVLTFDMHQANPEDNACACATPVEVGQTYSTRDGAPTGACPDKVYSFQPAQGLKSVITIDGLDKFEIREGICSRNGLQTIANLTAGENEFEFDDLEAGHAYYIFTEGCGSFIIEEEEPECVAIPLNDECTEVDIAAGQTQWFWYDFSGENVTVEVTFSGAGANKHKEGYGSYQCNGHISALRDLNGSHYLFEDAEMPAGVKYGALYVEDDVHVKICFIKNEEPPVEPNTCETALPFVVDPNNFFGTPIRVNKGCTWYNIDVDQVLAVMEANGVSADEPANLKVRIFNCNNTAANVTLTVYDACGGERIGSKTKTIPAASNGQCHEWNPDTRLTYTALKNQYIHKQLKLQVCTDLDIDIQPEPAPDVTPREGCEHATEIVPLQGYNIVGGETYWFYYDFDGCTYPSAVFAPKDGHKVEKYVAIWQGKDCSHLEFVVDGTSTRDTYNRTDIVPAAGRYYASIELTNLREEGVLTFDMHQANPEENACACATPVEVGQTYSTQEGAPAGACPDKVYSFQPAQGLKSVITIEGLDKFEIREGICRRNGLQTIANLTAGENEFEFDDLEAGHAYYIFTEGCGSFIIEEEEPECNAIDLNNECQTFHLEAGETKWFVNDFPGNSTVELTFTGAGAKKYKLGTGSYECNGQPEVTKVLRKDHYLNEDILIPAGVKYGSLYVEDAVDVTICFVVKDAPLNTEVTEKVCAGEQREIAGEMRTIDKDIEEIHVLQASTGVDSIVHYTYTIYHEVPQFADFLVERNQNVAEPLNLPAIEFQAATAETAPFDPANAYWEVDFDPIPNDLVFSRYNGEIAVALSAVVRPVIVDECGVTTYGDNQFIRFERHHGFGTHEETVCPNTDITLFDGQKHTVVADETFEQIFEWDMFGLGDTRYADTTITYVIHVYKTPALPNVTLPEVTITAGANLSATELANVDLTAPVPADPTELALNDGVLEISLDGEDFRTLDLNEPINTLDAQVRVKFTSQLCDQTLTTAPVAVNVNRVQREQEVINVDCAPYTITLGDGTQHIVTAEEDIYYATLEDLNTVGDQLVEVTTHYINHVKVEPTVADYDFTGLDQITAGEALSLTEPEITEDPVYPAAIIAKGWEISLDGGEFGEYVAGTPVYATNAQVRFKVQTECADEPQYSNLHKITVEKIVNETSFNEVLCPGWLDLPDGSKRFIGADEQFDITVAENEFTDHVYHYDLHVYVQPTVTVEEAPASINAGDVITLPNVTVAEDANYPAPIKDQYWEINLDNAGWIRYYNGAINAHNVQLRYVIEYDHVNANVCFDNLVTEAQLIVVNKVVTPATEEMTVCAGTEVTLASGAKHVVNGEEVFVDRYDVDEFHTTETTYTFHVFVLPTLTVGEVPASIVAGETIDLPEVTLSDESNVKKQYWEANIDNQGWAQFNEDAAVNAHNVQLRYVVEFTQCFDDLRSDAQLVVVENNVTEQNDEQTVCAGTEVTLRSGAKHVVNGEEVFVDRFEVDEFHTIVTTYTFHVFVLPTLTVGEAPATITAGDVITLPAVTLSDESNVKDQYWEVNLDNAGWARYYNGAINANNVQLRYVVEFTQCFDDLRSEAQLIVVENNVTDETEEMTVCPGTEVTLRSGAKHVVNGEEVFVDRFVVDAYHTTVTTYTFHVYVAPTVTIAAVDNEMTAGDAIVLPTVTLSQETYAAPIREQYWEANLDNNGWNRYNEGTPVYARNVQIRYVVVFENCFDNFVSASQLINVNKAHSDEDAIDVTQCVGTTYTMANGVVYTFAERQETVVFTIPDPDRFGAQYQDFADKTYTYNFNYLTTPEFELTTLPEGICGEPLILTDPTYTQGANDAALEGEIQWQIRAGEGNASFIPYDGSAQVGSQVVVRYTATTECGAKITSDPMTVILRTPEFDEDDVQIGVQRYGWLLMINKNAIEAEFNRTLEESNVSWYKVVSNADFQSNETNDQFLGNGFYYTTDHSLTGTGEYYAVIEISSVPGTCGATLHSQIFDFNTARESVRLLSTLLTNSDEVTVINLDSETESEVSIVDMTGQTVYRTRTIGTATLTMPAQQSGYYMVRVNGGINDATLKFVVK